jgi:hypothetical protein
VCVRGAYSDQSGRFALPLVGTSFAIMLGGAGPSLYALL